MCQHAQQVLPGPGQQGRGLRQLRIVRAQAGTVAVAVDFQQQIKNVFALQGKGGQLAGALRTVQQQGEAYAPLTQSQSARQLARRDAHGVADVRDAGFREIFGLRQGGDGDGSLRGDHAEPRHVHAFAGFAVRAQRHAQSAQTLVQAGDVAAQTGFIQEQGRGGQMMSSHRRSFGKSVLRDCGCSECALLVRRRAA